MESMIGADEQRAIRSAVDRLGPSDGWSEYPGGWPGDIEAALVDAVFSARAVYLTSRGRGIQPLVVAWRGERRRAGRPNLEALRDEIEQVGPEAWAASFGNSQHSPGRPNGAKGGPTKAAAVLEAAIALSSIGVSTAVDITESNVADVRAALRRVPGIGFATTNYFLMLLGRPAIKPDRMVHRFLARAVGRRLTDREAEMALTAIAADLGVDVHLLDYEIWKRESDAARHGVAPPPG